jgi:hypothetical protein
VAIYVVRRDDGSNLVKIGYSGEPKTRVADISREVRCKVTLIWDSGTEHGAATERQLHKLFHYWRVQGEWFNFGNTDAVAIVQTAMAVVDLLVVDPCISAYELRMRQTQANKLIKQDVRRALRAMRRGSARKARRGTESEISDHV